LDPYKPGGKYITIVNTCSALALYSMFPQSKILMRKKGTSNLLYALKVYDKLSHNRTIDKF